MDNDRHEDGSRSRPATVEFRIGREKRQVPYFPGETILETARRANIPVPAGCEQGNCGACIVTLLQGTVRMRTNSVLSVAEVDGGLALACQSLPDGPDLVVEVY